MPGYFMTKAKQEKKRTPSVTRFQLEARPKKERRRYKKIQTSKEEVKPSLRKKNLNNTEFPPSGKNHHSIKRNPPTPPSTPLMKRGEKEGEPSRSWVFFREEKKGCPRFEVEKSIFFQVSLSGNCVWFCKNKFHHNKSGGGGKRWARRERRGREERLTFMERERVIIAMVSSYFLGGRGLRARSSPPSESYSVSFE